MANLTLIEAMTKTADLVYEKVKTLISQSGGGTVNYEYKPYPVQIGTVNGQTLYRYCLAGKVTGATQVLATINLSAKSILKINCICYIKDSNGKITFAKDISQYVDINTINITLNNNYPSNLSDPMFEWNLMIEFTS